MSEKKSEGSNKLPKPLDKMLVTDLKAELKKRGLDTSGLKKDLLQRLKDAIAREEEQSAVANLSSESAPSDEKNSAQVISQENKPHEEPLEQNENQKMSESPTLKRKRIDDAEAASVHQETEENAQTTQRIIDTKPTEDTTTSTQTLVESEKEQGSDTTKSSPPPSKKPKTEQTQHQEPNNNQNSEFSYTPIVWNPPSSQSSGQSTTTTTQNSLTASNSSGTSRSTSSSYDSLGFIPPSAAEEAVIRHNQSRTVKPSQRPPTNTLHIVGFVRPFTLAQVKTLLSQHGTITNFWMNDIKSQCYVSYETVEQAEKTREAVYDLIWPVQAKGKPLVAEYVTEEEADVATGNKFRPRSEVVATPSATTSEVHAMSSTSQKENNSTDITTSASSQQKVNPLDTLFRKTKTKPHLYWLPLTDEQVAAKQKATREERKDETRR
jgi:apoptotic chromatin condensation inducer in the nucleus